MGLPAPVEYAVAVEVYLDRAGLSSASRRVYQISLASWTWALVGTPVPHGPLRRGAVPPVVPLALLDDPGSRERVAAAFGARTAIADARTANRELSALRSAVGWWRELGWIRADPTAGLRHRHPDAVGAPLSMDQVAALFLLPVSLREHALWRLLHDSGAAAAEVLALDADQLDLSLHRLRPRAGESGGAGAWRGAGIGSRGAGAGLEWRRAGLEWREGTSQVLRWLLAGRTWGPVFVTGRRAPARVAVADMCRVTGQARMSYRRAAEIFTTLTRPLDPAGRGWTLHQLSAAGRAG